MSEHGTDDLVAIRAIIPDYPGYGDERSRLMSDRLVRAWLGSCLASARERLASSVVPAELARLDDLIFRCQFPDQHFVALIEHARMEERTVEFLMDCDRKLLGFAQAACDVDPAGLPALVGATNAAFDERTPISA